MNFKKTATAAVVLGLALGLSACDPTPAPGTPSSAPKPASTVPFHPQTLLQVSGNGSYTSDKFTAAGDGDYEIFWTYNEGSFGMPVSFDVEADDYGDTNVTGPDVIGPSGSGVVNVYNDAGTHFLNVYSEGDWTLKVVTTP